MYATSNDYRAAMRHFARCIRAKVTAGGETYTDDGALVSLTWERGAGTTEKLFGNAISACLSVELSGVGAIPPSGAAMQAFFTPDGMTETVPTQPFIVESGELDTDAKTAVISGFDAMLRLEKHKISKIGVEYPLSLADYTAAMLSLAGLELADRAWYQADLTLPTAPNLNGDETCREVLAKIAECAFGNATIDRAGKVVIRSILSSVSPTDIDPDLYFECTFGEAYGPINTLTLARLPQGDNIYREDADNVAQSGRVALTIADNPFLDVIREDVIDGMFAEIKGTVLTPYSLDWCGDPAYDSGDPIRLTDTKGNQATVFFGAEVLEFDGGLRSAVDVHPVTAESINYEKGASIKESVKRTLLEVDKANNRIQSVAEQTYNKEQTDIQIQSKIEQNASAIRAEVSETYTTKGETDSLRAKLELDYENFRVEFENEKETIVNINGDLSSFQELIYSYFDFTPDGLLIGKSDSTLQTKYSNERISFINGSEEIAYIEHNMLFFRTAHFIEGISIGGTDVPGNKWALQKVPGGLAFVWLG